MGAGLGEFFPALAGQHVPVRLVCLLRDRDKRYQNASEILTDLELFLYSDRYGPTNEKLGVYLKDLFGAPTPTTPPAPQPILASPPLRG